MPDATTAPRLYPVMASIRWPCRRPRAIALRIARVERAMKDRNRNIAVLAIVLGTAALLVALGVR